MFGPVNLSDQRSFPERYWRASMSANGFFVAEQRPELGRVFTEEDERHGAPPVTVLSHHLWQDRFGKDPAILGKTIFLDDVATTVIGVMPSGKRFPEDCDLWTPLPSNFALLFLFGRLRDGVNIAGARAELGTLAHGLAERHPGTNKGLTADVRPIAESTGVFTLRKLFAALWVAVGFVLLIACADVANMLLARGAGRTREVAIRVAIGAGRGRLVRQLLIESVLLSMAGGCLGWLVAVGGLSWFDAATGGIVKPTWLNLTLDRTAFAYLASISMATGILFGLAPAVRLANVNVHAAMKDGGPGVASGRRVLSAASFLVAFQMALCMVLLAGAGLTIRSVVNLYAAPVGVNTSSVLTLHVNLPQARYPGDHAQIVFHRALKTRLDSIAGVESTGIVSNLPFGGYWPVQFHIEGMTGDPAFDPHAGVIVADADYFRVMQVNPKRGRLFNESDANAGDPAALVNESFAAKYLAGSDPLGKRFRLRRYGFETWLTVVGVVPDILQNYQHLLEHDPLIYFAFAAAPRDEMYVVAKTRIPPGLLTNEFRRAVRSVDPSLAVYDVRAMERSIAESGLGVRLTGGMFSVFAGIALVLAALGLYAVMANSISQRTQEIGVRVALGGTRRDILRLVFVQGLGPMTLGMGIGLPAAFAMTRVLQAQLVGVSPGDPVTFVLAVGVLAGAGVLGCAIPARRAMRVDPIVALRYE